MSAPGLVLHTYFRSSCSWRVRIALAHKGLAYTPAFVHIVKNEQHEPSFVALNAAAQVPVLEAREPGGEAVRIAQSIAILEYLEERFPERALLPREPAARARARQLAEIVNSGVQPFQNLATQRHLKGLGVDEAAFSKHFVARGLEALEREAARGAGDGPFLLGASPTLADVCLVPQLFGARRFGLDPAAWPTLARAEAACAAIPAWQTARPEAQADAQP